MVRQGCSGGHGFDTSPFHYLKVLLGCIPALRSPLVDDDNGLSPQRASWRSGEFAAIAGIAARLAGPAGVGEIWIGDDAASVHFPAGAELLVTVDTVVAGVHADLSLTGLCDLGWKALAAAVSDIAAMGGRPGHAVVSVAGPGRAAVDLDELYDGLAEAARVPRLPGGRR